MANKKQIAEAESSKRPANYVPQQGSKAALTLADFTDENLFGELRRRGYNGELRFTKIINV